MAALKLKLMVPQAGLCLLLLLMPPFLLPPGCVATRPDPTQGPYEGNKRTCTELSKRSPLLYCEHHACVVNCRIEGFAEGGFCNWLRCLCKRPC
ncbi:hypothetical protein CFC21_069975 [Triticum aestivum]|uniref:Knottin scorpion toxin-like domain-containing protein n=3 Tax=Triticum TaxID=4564 RepID=A0A9R0WZH2_TRITD|nr:hypothetical protein CFC21_069975 [Triticum aestivum]VAI27254.1 unnamed protein product [Triticum turgidum subsp. durum]